MKRFYKEATAGDDGSGPLVLLDGKPVLTPKRRPLRLPTPELAAAVAAEWAEQGEVLATAAMDLTRLATTATDLLPDRRPDMLAEAAGYAGSDLLCYRAAHPAALVAWQDQRWQPWLDHAAQRYGAPLAVTTGTALIRQPPAALALLGAHLRRQDDWTLTGLHAATTTTGSLVLALALADGTLPPGAAFEAALAEELFTVERYGLEEEQEKRHLRLRAELTAIASWHATLAPGPRTT